MARRSLASLPFPLAALVVFASLGACTSILGDFTLKPGDGGVPVGEGGPPADAPTSTVDASDAPVTSPFMVDAIQVAAGDRHTCALRKDRNVYCWGDNSKGQLGTTSSGGDKKPLRVSNLTNVHAIAAGANHTCALTIPGVFAQGGQVFCWGDNAFGKLGVASTTAKSEVPIQVKDGSSQPLSKVGAITAGHEHTCASFDGGSVLCWGANVSGQLGNAPNNNDNIVARPINPTSPTQFLAGGAGHTCSIGISGGPLPTVVCWGNNDSNQVGRGTGAGQTGYQAPGPVNFPAASNQEKRLVAGGFTHSCAIDVAQAVYCWGSNYAGEAAQASPGAGIIVAQPGVVPGLQALAISAGEQTTCAVSKGLKVACWGRNDLGQLGIGTAGGGAQSVPQEVQKLTDVGVIAVGTRHACAIQKSVPKPGLQDDAAGAVFCWGAGSDNRLGNGSTDFSATPVPVVAF
ncbi:MAG: regulator of chromosome condensation [Myxococcaceae bacterium]|nr:regulator of chromosome condensation [Myxococcaceae bacterium]